MRDRIGLVIAVGGVVLVEPPSKLARFIGGAVSRLVRGGTGAVARLAQLVGRAGVDIRERAPRPADYRPEIRPTFAPAAAFGWVGIAIGCVAAGALIAHM